MRLVLVGPPGSGKGTQAKRLTDSLGLRLVGTGDLLRSAIERGTPTGRAAEPMVKAGHLVPDDLVNQLVADLFRGPERPEQFVFDGYPRTLAQATWFDDFLRREGLDLTAVVRFVISDEEVVRRLHGGRLVCPGCQAVYNLRDCPPKKPGVCDRCGTALISRQDDEEKIIRERLHIFHETTGELVRYYQRRGLLHDVQSQASPDTIYNTIVTLLKAKA
jgi:adenylate kinase